MLRRAVLVPALGAVAASAASAAAAGAALCGCADCESSGTVYAGMHKEVTSPMCAEGSVATIEVLRSSSSSGLYKVTTRNLGSYVYYQASMEHSVGCFQVPDQHLPVVGSERQLRVVLNCESFFKCDFSWDIQFGCRKLGVLQADKPFGGGVQVLSDVDDTIVCPSPQCNSITDCTLHGRSISHFLAGKDNSLESGEFYPGVAELMLGLALGPERSPDFVPARPMLLSARPKEAGSFAAITQSSTVNQYFEVSGKRQDIDSWGVSIDGSMYGSLKDGTNFASFGKTKAESYDAVAARLPQTRFAFFGDNGQGDVCGAQSMLESPHGDRMVAIFIHKTVEENFSLHTCEDPTRGSFQLHLPEGPKVHYFKSHSDAAEWALERHLISCCSARYVYEVTEQWHACRCRGQACGQLPTGVSDLADRQDTFAFCAKAAEAQALLLTKISGCMLPSSCLNLREPAAAIAELG